MQIFLVVNNPRNWPLKIPGVEVIQAKRYLTEPAFSRISAARVFNLARSYGYQSLGYYVSLLAAARGHRPIPDISTIRDMYTPAIIRLVSDDINEVLQKSLARIKGSTFTLSIYFGNNVARRHQSLSRVLFNLFQAPLLRANFVKDERTGVWQFQNINPIAVSDVPDSHRPFVVKSAMEYFSAKARRLPRRSPSRYYMAILHRPGDPEPPSNMQALRKFMKAGQRVGIGVELITKDDFGRLAEFDALFIRETTRVTDHTFRFARCAEAEGLVVIDDSQSIIKCANKVYLAELLAHYRISMPKTIIVHRDNLDIVSYELGLPCVLKRPDSSFSLGVIKVNTREELEREALTMLARSELIIAQEYLPTKFDWRIGVLGNEPLYACRYFMVRNSWQIIRRSSSGKTYEGESEAVPLEDVPPEVIKLALRATRHIGEGLYGVDLKQSGKRFYVIEVNDNPNIDVGTEDKILKNRLYDRIMNYFVMRLDARKSADNGK